MSRPRSKLGTVLHAALRILRWLITLALVMLIRLYQVILSPFFAGHCRFTPTCSHYAVEALRTHGPIYGLWLTFRRLMACQPFSRRFGFDPVPPKARKRPAA